MIRKFHYFIRRSIAYIIDVTLVYLIVMFVIQFLVLMPIREHLGLDEAWFKSGWHVQIYVWLTISLPVWCYFILMEASDAMATFGKRLVKLKVLDERSKLRISYTTSIKRTFLKLLPWELIHIGLNLPTPVWFEEQPDFRYVVLTGTLLFVFYIISLLISPTQNTLYDVLIKTRVVPFYKQNSEQ